MDHGIIYLPWWWKWLRDKGVGDARHHLERFLFHISSSSSSSSASYHQPSSSSSTSSSSPSSYCMIWYLKGVLHAMAGQEARWAGEHRRATRKLRMMMIIMIMIMMMSMMSMMLMTMAMMMMLFTCSSFACSIEKGEGACCPPGLGLPSSPPPTPW